MHQSVQKPGLFPDLNEAFSFPSVVEIQTHTRCNAKCICCPYEALSNAEHHGRMDDDLLWKILEDCVRNRERIAQIVPYHNNEPFLDKRMVEVLAFIKREIGAPVELATNASALVPALIDKLCSELFVSTLRISFFGGNPDSYERRMQLPWERSRRNIEYLLRSAQSIGMAVELVMVATSDLRQEEIDACRAIWTPLGAKVTIFGYLDRVGSGAVQNLLPYNAHKRRVIGCDLNRPFERICILSNGDCIICSQDWHREVILGNVADTDISTVWNSAAYEALRNRFTGAITPVDQNVCHRCKLAIFE
ncbi:radical SAM/SPASM domain-containing protein [Polaromonas sp. P5_D5]